MIGAPLANSNAVLDQLAASRVAEQIAGQCPGSRPDPAHAAAHALHAARAGGAGDGLQCAARGLGLWTVERHHGDPELRARALAALRALAGA